MFKQGNQKRLCSVIKGIWMTGKIHVLTEYMYFGNSIFYTEINCGKIYKAFNKNYM
jgi:hypothetical protein